MEFGAILFITIAVAMIVYTIWQVTKTNKWLKTSQENMERVQQMLKEQAAKRQEEIITEEK